MKKIICSDINGIVQNISPIVHNQINDLHGAVSDDKKNNCSKFRRTPQILNINGVPTKKFMPVISGNSIRGICRRALYDYTFESMGVTLDEIFEGNDKISKNVFFSLHNGGLTPKGTAVEKTDLAAYDEIAKIPFVGLFGFAYFGHMFVGSGSFGLLTPLCKENLYLYAKNITFSDEFVRELPTFDDLGLDDLSVDWNTRRANARDNSAKDSNRAASNKKDIKEGETKGDSDAMIYGFETLPPGLCFVSINRVITDNPEVKLAFDAALALLFYKYKTIGGRIGSGFGNIEPIYGFDTLDHDKAIEDYGKLVSDNKDLFIKRLRMIHSELNYSEKGKDESKGNKKVEKGMK